MIKNQKEYEYSLECARSFQESLSLLDQDEEMKQKDIERWQMNRDAKQYRLDKLHAEISEYEKCEGDDVLVRMCQKGDAQSFRVLYRRHSPR